MTYTMVKTPLSFQLKDIKIVKRGYKDCKLDKKY